MTPLSDHRRRAQVSVGRSAVCLRLADRWSRRPAGVDRPGARTSGVERPGVDRPGAPAHPASTAPARPHVHHRTRFTGPPARP